MQGVRDWLNGSPGEVVMWTASVAFTSFIDIQVLQWARTLLAIGAWCPGSQLLASLVGTHEPKQKKKKQKLKKSAALSASPRKCLGRGWSCRPATELTQLVTAVTAHLCRWVWAGEETRAWEEAGEEQIGKTHQGRAVHGRAGLVPAGFTLLPPPAPPQTSENSNWLRKCTRTTKSYLCQHSRREFLQWHECWTSVSHPWGLQPACGVFAKNMGLGCTKSAGHFLHGK